MTDFASVGAARVRHCHCHDEPWASTPARIEEGKNPARISSFVGALIGSIRGRFAQMPMLVGGRSTEDLGTTRGTPLGSTFSASFGASTLASPAGIAVGAERVPQNALEEVLIPLENKLGPYGVLVGAAVGGLATWITLDAMQSAKDAARSTPAPSLASSDRRRSRPRSRARWF